MPEPPPLEIRLFGAPTVRVAGVPIAPPRTRKSLWLLALLVMRPDREVDRAWLAGTLWPESSENQARYNLRRCLSELRSALGEQARCLHSPTSSTLRFHSGNAWVDVILFDQEIRRCETAELERAVQRYGGPLLEGCTEEWLPSERVMREQQYLAARERLAELALAHDDPGAAVAHARAALAAVPLSETALRLLLRALAARSEYAAATTAFRDYRLLLAHELNDRPAPETLALFEEIRRAARTAASPSVAARTAPTSAAEALPRSSTNPLLPIPANRFVGREPELAQLAQLLTDHPLVTLVGPGGVGKTRLALQAAELLGRRFEQGVGFADLGAVSTPALVPLTIAAALGVREQPGRTAWEGLFELAGGCSALLVLDNCEHLLAEATRAVGELSTAGPSLRILATSRHPLGLPQEFLLPLNPLPLPDCLGSTLPQPDQLLRESAAVRLFVDRAQQAQPTFRLTPGNAAATLAICRRLDGLPLAMELVAARVRGIGVEQMEARLHGRLRVLASGGAERPTRHRTLHAAMDWSHELLDDAGRQLLARLSIFAGSFSLEAVEAVCGEDAPEPLGTLLELVDSSLVRFEAGEATGRYRLLETIREYARERLVESGEEPAVEARYREYYSELVGELSVRLQGSEQHAWIACMAREQDNLRELLARAEPPDRLRLCATLWQFWFLRGQSSEGFRWLMESLEGDAALIAPAAVRGTALYGAGNLAIRLGNREGATRLLREALAVQELCGLPAAQARTLNSLGAMALEHGDYSEARMLLEQSLHLLGEAGDGSGQGHCMANLAAIALAQEDLDTADTLLDACIPLLRQADAEQALARCLNNQGIIAKSRGELVRSAECHAQGLEIHRRLGDRGGIALTLSNLADLEAVRGNFGRSIQQFREALELWEELESTSGVAYTLNGLARLAAARGNAGHAAVLFGAAQALREALQFPLPPLEQAGQEQVEQEVRAALGEAQAQAQWRQGELMTWRQAGEYARAWVAEEDPCG